MLKIRPCLIALIVIVLTACQSEVYNPKPRGYFRIAVKDTTYTPLPDIAPYTFEISSLAHVETRDKPDEKYWLNLVYPQLNAILHITYKPLKTNKLEDCISDARMMAAKQINKADDIEESTVLDTAAALYGKIYEILGNEAASPYQFWLTDRKNHFFRASLYFNSVPQNDSLAPHIDFLKKDMLHLIETFEWKEEKKKK